ncbi:GIY-YIG nuclease family protein [Streptomyces rimosus]|uniref:GIY-YIG nuclease family protein n=1 Tax=Streptomyces rimosus TaxID=1927 RepID=UPI00131A98E4|nr:GIY-YIG nuclease family protein [Streptomyces rimosus]
MATASSGTPIQMFQDPEDSIISYSTPFKGYVYERDPKIPNYWIAVRRKTEEEMQAEEVATCPTRPRRRCHAEANGSDLQRTALYRLRDAAGELLYVGISTKPPQRWSQHAVDKVWWPEVADLSLEWFDSKSEALAAERRAIRAESPRHNVVHNQAPIG